MMRELFFLVKSTESAKKYSRNPCEHRETTDSAKNKLRERSISRPLNYDSSECRAASSMSMKAKNYSHHNDSRIQVCSAKMDLTHICLNGCPLFWFSKISADK
mmetsp:Transcript_42817/g.49220  ORF Transcript_42817/g.49220 Transcript_42817/m.49220 type:complete len:103 (+) Transcript_42817:399-707(+)